VVVKDDSSQFTEGAYRIPAYFTLHAQPAVAQLRQFPSPDLLSGKNSRQNDMAATLHSNTVVRGL